MNVIVARRTSAHLWVWPLACLLSGAGAAHAQTSDLIVYAEATPTLVGGAEIMVPPASSADANAAMMRPITADTPAAPVALVPTPCRAREGAVVAELYKHRQTLPRRDALRAARALCHEAERAQMDPLLLLAVIGVESSFNPRAVSPVGAEGLMQLMPHTGSFLAARANLAWSQRYAFDPAINIRIGTRYLATLRDAFHGRIDWALTAYNRGPTATHVLLRHHHGLPHDVRASYAAPVLQAYERLRRIYGSAQAEL